MAGARLGDDPAMGVQSLKKRKADLEEDVKKLKKALIEAKNSGARDAREAAQEELEAAQAELVEVNAQLRRHTR